jgi:hypothetical protein
LNAVPIASMMTVGLTGTVEALCAMPINQRWQM